MYGSGKRGNWVWDDVVVNIDSTHGMLGDCLDCDLQDLEITLIVSVYSKTKSHLYIVVGSVF